jgi:ribosome biogenesis GTPase
MSFTLAQLGWDAARAAEFAPLAASCVAGRVSRVDRGAVDVLTTDNPLRLTTTAADDALAVGDWLALAVDDRRWYVDTVLSRRTTLRRATAGGQSHAQILAANVDVALVVVPAVPEPRLGMTERLVAVAWDSGATPVVVMTKSDLTSDPDGIADDLRASAPGVDVVAVTASRPDGYDALLPHLRPGATYCLLGRSGAGKSTLANAIAGQQLFATADIRDDGKGRHTTTFRELVVLASGAILLDTPGLRGVGVWLDSDGLDRAFSDVEELAARCRFADCGHDTEPGCAVLGAIDDGSLDERRLLSWRKLEREARWLARRHDARLRAEEAKRWKAISMEMRRSGRARP